MLHVLRRANGKSLTTRAITLQVMAERGLDVRRPKLVREIAGFAAPEWLFLD